MALYAFTTATFTPGGSLGREGPTLAEAKTGLTGPEVADWKNNTDYLNVTSGIISWTVPKNGIYKINALGARGGKSTGDGGGLGARLIGDFVLSEGDVIKILVGQKGNPLVNYGGGGGGGTFVIKSPYNDTGSILVIAGGGGGRAQAMGTLGSNAVLTTAGGRPTTEIYGAVSGGTNGGGGSAYQLHQPPGGDGGGGGGFTGKGQTSFHQQGNYGGGYGGSSFTNGGLGGISNTSSARTNTAVGSFGGGGGGTQTSNGGGGGGGGYSGGAGGAWSGGGGGGSYNAGSSQVNTAGVGDDDGAVTITFFDQALSTSSSLVSAGETVTLTLNTSDALNNTSVPYTITGTGITTADINGASLTGNFAVVNNTATLQLLNTVQGANATKTFTIATSASTVSVTLTYLVSGTQPSTPGTAVLTSVVTVTPNATIATTNSLTQEGIIINSAKVPLTGTSTVIEPPVIATTNSLTQEGIIINSTKVPLTGTSKVIEPPIIPSFSPTVTQLVQLLGTRQILIR
jgi:hypothetical protein